MTMHDLPHGAVAIRLHMFQSPSQEIESACRPPWPRWMRRLYELERLSGGAAPEDAEVAMSAAIGAVATRLRHRLELLSWCVGALEEIGWEVVMDGDDVLASKVTLPQLAREELEEHGIFGPMSKVCDLDDSGLPRIVERWQAR